MPMRLRIFVAALLLAACASTQRSVQSGRVPNRRLDQLARAVLASEVEQNPVVATRLGDHRFDGRWPDLSAAAIARRRESLAGFQRAVEQIAADELDAQDRVDRALLKSRLAAWLFALDELHEVQLNPLYYVGVLASGLDPLVTRSFAPAEERMESLAQRLRSLATLVSAAKQNLGRPSRPHTEAAAAQALGLVKLVEGLEEKFEGAPAASRAALKAAAQEALGPLRELHSFFAGELLARSDGDFRIGKELFKRQLAAELDADVTPEELLRGARELLDKTLAEMAGTARELYPELFGKPAPEATTAAERKALTRAVLDKLAADHPDEATILPEAKRAVAEATAWVKSHALVTVPEEPMDVIEMPEYNRGRAAVYCSSSGALEKKRETFVAISPPPSSWSVAQQASYYREYNRSMLAELIVHEAMPGHFLQIAHAHDFHSPARDLLGSGTFIEGWAVYGEWVMANSGFGGPRVRMMRLKMLARVCANALLDSGVHAGDLSEAGALELLRGETFQEEGEAMGKWRRAQLSSGQLSTYYVGFVELMKVRALAEKQPGFEERKFHDAVLSFGSPPPRELKALLGL